MIYNQGATFRPEPHLEYGPSVSAAAWFLMRLSDGFFLDFSDSTFKSSAWTTQFQALTDASPFWIDATGITLPSSNDSYQVWYREDGSTDYFKGEKIIVNNSFTQDQLSSLANVGSATHKSASSYVLTTGTQSANTYASTEALDGSRHEHTDTAGVVDLYYEFIIGAGTPSSVQVTGYITGINDDLDVYGYDWTTLAWVQIGNKAGSALATDSVDSYDMFVGMVGSGVNEGTVRIRFYKAAGLTTATLAIDQIFVAFNQGQEGYQDSAVWFDSSASNTGTQVGIDGTARNPVSTEAAVNTLLASTNLLRVGVRPGSTITFATSHVGEIWEGDAWSVDFGSQDVGGSTFRGTTASGVGTGSSTIHVENSTIDTATLHPFHSHEISLEGTLTLGAAGGYVIADSHSGKAGSVTPIIDMGAAIGNVDLAMPGYYNGIEIQNLNSTGTDSFSISGDGQIIYAASSSGAVSQRGMWRVTNTGGVAITADDNTTILSTVVDDVWDEIIPGAHVINNSAGALLNDTAAKYTKGKVDDLTGASATSFLTNLDSISVKDDFFNDQRVRFVDGPNAGQAKVILSYRGVDGLVTVDEAFDSTPTLDDKIQVDAVHVHPVTQIADAINTRIAVEAYPTDGAAATQAELLYSINQLLSEFVRTGTAVSVKQRDGITEAFTLALDSATAPTSSTQDS